MAVLGNTRKFYVGSGHTWVGGETSNTFSMNANQIEVSDKTNTWQTFISGVKGATASATVNADHTDTAQTELLTGLMAGTTVKCFIGTLGSGNTPTEGFAFDAIVTSVSDTNDNGSVASRTISVVATGEVTKY